MFQAKQILFYFMYIVNEHIVNEHIRGISYRTAILQCPLIFMYLQLHCICKLFDQKHIGIGIIKISGQV